MKCLRAGSPPRHLFTTLGNIVILGATVPHPKEAYEERVLTSADIVPAWTYGHISRHRFRLPRLDSLALAGLLAYHEQHASVAWLGGQRKRQSIPSRRVETRSGSMRSKGSAVPKAGAQTLGGE